MYEWNTDKSTYQPGGGRIYRKGDELPAEVMVQMGEETAKEYEEKGLILDVKIIKIDKKAELEKERLELLYNAKSLGLKPNKNIGVEKLNIMLDNFNALQDLKKEALALGIDPSDDVTFEELTALVDEKKVDPVEEEKAE